MTHPRGRGQILRTALTLRFHGARPPDEYPRAPAARLANNVCKLSGYGRDCTAHTTRNALDRADSQAGQGGITLRSRRPACLVLQTIALPLALAQGASTVTIRGGTHVPWSPSFHYLEHQWLPHLQAAGLRLRLSLTSAGFYPQGGGELLASIRGTESIQPLERSQRGQLLRVRGLSGVANLDLDIARRQKLQALRRLEPVCRDSKIEILDLPSPVKGTFILIWAEFANGQAACGALWAPGKRAERVADEAADELLACLDSAQLWTPTWPTSCCCRWRWLRESV